MITLTDNAISQIRNIAYKEGNLFEQIFLRVSIQAGGCSGLSYKLEFIEEFPLTKNDKISVVDDITLVIDPKSHLFLDGMTIDFSGGLNGSGFIFNNPNAKRSCGCGTSFST